jgi:hypothetical protein
MHECQTFWPQPLEGQLPLRYDARDGDSFVNSEPGFRRGRPPMPAKLNAFALVGIDAVPVEVEVDAAAGMPKIVHFGLIAPFGK